jgi:hypothetical protein
MTSARIKTTNRHKTMAAPLGREKRYDALNPTTTEIKAIAIERRVVG